MNRALGDRNSATCVDVRGWSARTGPTAEQEMLNRAPWWTDGRLATARVQRRSRCCRWRFPDVVSARLRRLGGKGEPRRWGLLAAQRRVG
jgi:hypothetical protein